MTTALLPMVDFALQVPTYQSSRQRRIRQKLRKRNQKNSRQDLARKRSLSVGDALGRQEPTPRKNANPVLPNSSASEAALLESVHQATSVEREPNHPHLQAKLALGPILARLDSIALLGPMKNFDARMASTPTRRVLARRLSAQLVRVAPIVTEIGTDQRFAQQATIAHRDRRSRPLARGAAITRVEARCTETIANPVSRATIATRRASGTSW